jgi:elongator complex protein 2
VERAFLPSLGLSNKATADPEQESTKYAGPLNDDNFVNSLNTVEYKHGNRVKLPSERDLGVTTLWPETRKLFGHDSELVCLDACRAQEGSNFPTLVASSCKARNDVASAAIRLWNVRLGKCVSVLKVSAVTKCAFSFSVIEKSDARYLYLIST